MPTELLPVAVVLVLILAWPRLSEATSSARLFVEVLGLALATIALIAAIWALYWFVEQRW